MARPSDIDDIMALENVCFNKWTREPENVYRERIECFPRGFMVIEDAGRIVGMVSSEIRMHDPSLSAETFALGHSIKDRLDLSGDELYVSSISILPDHRGKGYGGILFRAVLDNVLGNFGNVRYVVLIVNENWTSARSIYRKGGFRDLGIIKGFFIEDDGSVSDGMIMRHDRTADRV